MESTHTKNESAVSDSDSVSLDEPGRRSSRRGFLYSSVFLRVAASIVFIPCFIVITNTGGYHYLLLIMLLVTVAMQVVVLALPSPFFPVAALQTAQ